MYIFIVLDIILRLHLRGNVTYVHFAKNKRSVRSYLTDISFIALSR